MNKAFSLSHRKTEANRNQETQMNELQDKIAIVTWASSDIGYETARLFASKSAKLIVSARRQKELNALVAKISNAGNVGIWRRLNNLHVDVCWIYSRYAGHDSLCGR